MPREAHAGHDQRFATPAMADHIATLDGLAASEICHPPTKANATEYVEHRALHAVAHRTVRGRCVGH